jgi:hypothetical protein
MNMKEVIGFGIVWPLLLALIGAHFGYNFGKQAGKELGRVEMRERDQKILADYGLTITKFEVLRLTGDNLKDHETILFWKDMPAHYE